MAKLSTLSQSVWGLGGWMEYEFFCLVGEGAIREGYRVKTWPKNTKMAPFLNFFYNFHRLMCSRACILNICENTLNIKD